MTDKFQKLMDFFLTHGRLPDGHIRSKERELWKTLVELCNPASPHYNKYFADWAEIEGFSLPFYKDRANGPNDNKE